MNHLKYLLAILAIVFIAAPANAQSTGPKVADIVFVVDLDFVEFDETGSWLTGTVGSNGLDIPGAIRQLDAKLQAENVFARYGLVVFNSSRVSFVSFEGGSGSPTPNDLWVCSPNLNQLEQRLGQEFVNPSAGNSEGNQGQDAIARVLGLNLDANNNSPITPEYQFRKGARSIIFISDNDTEFDPLAINPVDREELINGTRAELEDNDITFHSVTQSLFAADADGKDGAGDPEIQNRSHFFTLDDDDLGLWKVDQDTISFPPGENTPQPLYFLVRRETSKAGVGYENELIDEELIQDNDDNTNRNAWTIESCVRTYDNEDTGSAIFFFGRDEDFPEIPGEMGSPASIEIFFNRLTDGNIEYDPANEPFLRSDYFSSDVLPFVPEPNPIIVADELLDVEIRFNNVEEFIGGGVEGAQIHLIINGVCVGFWRLSSSNPTMADPDADLIRMKAQMLHHVALGSYSGAAFDDYQLFIRPSLNQQLAILPLPCNVETPFDLSSRTTKTNPFKQFFCNDFGTEDGAQYDFDVFGISWRELSNSSPNAGADAFGYWARPNMFQESDNGKHVFSEGYQNLFYTDLAEATSGSAWMVLPITQLRNEDDLNEIHSGFTLAFVDVVSNSIEANSMVVGAAAFELAVNGVPENDSEGMQRSMVIELTATFNGDVGPLDSSSFLLVNETENEQVFPTLTTAFNGVNTVATFTFPDDSGFIGNSLEDGNHRLSTLFCVDGPTSGNNSATLYRLFGDGNGDRVVNVFDLLQLRNAFGSSIDDQNYNFAFDYSADEVINIFDLLQFRGNFGTSLPE